MPTTTPSAEAEDRPSSRPGAASRLITAIEALVADPATPRPDSGDVAEAELNPFHLAGRAAGLALGVARASGDESFPGAFAHTALASGIEWCITDPAARLAVLHFLAGAFYDLSLGILLPDVTAAAMLLMSAAELALVESADESVEQAEEAALELRERVHRCAVAIALRAEQPQARPETGS